MTRSLARRRTTYGSAGGSSCKIIVRAAAGRLAASGFRHRGPDRDLDTKRCGLCGGIMQTPRLMRNGHGRVQAPRNSSHRGGWAGSRDGSWWHGQAVTYNTLIESLLSAAVAGPDNEKAIQLIGLSVSSSCRWVTGRVPSFALTRRRRHNEPEKPSGLPHTATHILCNHRRRPMKNITLADRRGRAGSRAGLCRQAQDQRERVGPRVVARADRCRTGERTRGDGRAAGN